MITKGEVNLNEIDLTWVNWQEGGILADSEEQLRLMEEDPSLD